MIRLPRPAVPILFCALAPLAPSAAAQQSPSEPPEQLADQMLAIVNDQILTLADVYSYAAAVTRNSQPGPDDLQNSFRSQLADMLFREGFRLSGKDESVLDRRIEEEIQDRVKKAGSVSALAAQLEEYGSSIEQERKTLHRIFTSLYFRQIELGFAPEKGKKFKVKLEVSPQEMRDYYQSHSELWKQEFRVRARILLLGEEAGQAPAKERLMAFRKQLLDGKADFAELAKAHSLYRPTTGGSTGDVQPDKAGLAPAIQEFLSHSSPGDLSEVLPVGRRWALVRTETVQPAGVKAFSEVQDEIQNRLLDRKANALLRNTIQRLRKRVYLWGPDVDKTLDGMYPDPEAQEAQDL